MRLFGRSRGAATTAVEGTARVGAGAGARLRKSVLGDICEAVIGALAAVAWVGVIRASLRG